MRTHLWLLLIVGIVLLSSCKKDDDTHPYSFLESEVIREVNEHRQEQGLPDLRQLNLIREIARSHSKDMAKQIVTFGHDGFANRVDEIKASIQNVNGVGENVLYGADDAKAAVGMWLQSEGHKNNIEGSFTHTGVGIASDKDNKLYYTQIFVRVQN